MRIEIADAKNVSLITANNPYLKLRINQIMICVFTFSKRNTQNLNIGNSFMIRSSPKVEFIRRESIWPSQIQFKIANCNFIEILQICSCDIRYKIWYRQHDDERWYSFIFIDYATGFAQFYNIRNAGGSTKFTFEFSETAKIAVQCFTKN